MPPDLRLENPSWRVLLLIVALLATSLVQAQAPWSPLLRPAVAQDLEHKVKAAFLYQFMRYVEWPDSAFKSRTSPLVLAVVGTNPFGAALAALKNKRVHGRQIVVKLISSSQAKVTAHLVFVATSDAKARRAILKPFKGKPVLSVGDDKAFATGLGVIGFEMVKRKVRFHLNLQNARQAGLKIHPKLIKLARLVKGGHQR